MLPIYYNACAKTHDRKQTRTKRPNLVKFKLSSQINSLSESYTKIRWKN